MEAKISEVMEARLAARRTSAPASTAPILTPEVPPTEANVQTGLDAKAPSADGDEGEDARVQAAEKPSRAASGGEEDAEEVSGLCREEMGSFSSVM